MISYKPFRHYMIDNNIDRQYLIDKVGLGSNTITKLNQDEPVRLDILDKICLHFNITIEQVLYIGKS